MAQPQEVGYPAGGPQEQPPTASVCTYGQPLLDQVIPQLQVGETVTMHVTGRVTELAKNEAEGEGYGNRTEVRLEPTKVTCDHEDSMVKQINRVAGKKRGEPVSGEGEY